MSPGQLPAPASLDQWIEAGPLALFLDFDGTLVEIASTPEGIEVDPMLCRRLGQLALRVNGALAIVSGRAVEDISHHLGASLPVACAGSHGGDIRDAKGEILGAVTKPVPHAIIDEMSAFASREGLGFEAKPHGAALHYRRQPEKGENARAFAKQLAERHGWIAQDGKAVVELVEGETNKGEAVRTFMASAQFQGAQPWFIGDDLTDEHGFAACAQLGGGGIIVGQRASTSAQYSLADVASVHRWLGLC